MGWELLMTNGKSGDEEWARKHFSADEIGIFQLYIAAACISAVFAAQALHMAQGLDRRKKCDAIFSCPWHEL